MIDLRGDGHGNWLFRTGVCAGLLNTSSAEFSKTPQYSQFVRGFPVRQMCFVDGKSDGAVRTWAAERDIRSIHRKCIRHIGDRS